MSTRYEKPPITEAVIEFRFGQGVSESGLRKFCTRLKDDYPEVEPNYEVRVELEVKKGGGEPSPRVSNQFANFRLIGRDQSDLIVVGLNRMLASRLAPYSSWEEFSKLTLKNYGKLKSSTGSRSIARISTRFINRIDVPGRDQGKIRIDDYLKVEPNRSEVIPILSSFQIRVEGAVPEIGGIAIINTGSVPSPLIDHISFVLDIDLVRNQNLPKSDEEVEACLAELRHMKNKIFESFVTDASRELFGRV